MDPVTVRREGHKLFGRVLIIVVHYLDAGPLWHDTKFANCMGRAYIVVRGMGYRQIIYKKKTPARMEKKRTEDAFLRPLPGISGVPEGYRVLRRISEPNTEKAVPLGYGYIDTTQDLTENYESWVWDKGAPVTMSCVFEKQIKCTLDGVPLEVFGRQKLPSTVPMDAGYACGVTWTSEEGGMDVTGWPAFLVPGHSIIGRRLYSSVTIDGVIKPCHQGITYPALAASIGKKYLYLLGAARYGGDELVQDGVELVSVEGDAGLWIYVDNRPIHVEDINTRIGLLGAIFPHDGVSYRLESVATYLSLTFLQAGVQPLCNFKTLPAFNYPVHVSGHGGVASSPVVCHVDDTLETVLTVRLKVHADLFDWEYGSRYRALWEVGTPSTLTLYPRNRPVRVYSGCSGFMFTTPVSDVTRAGTLTPEGYVVLDPITKQPLPYDAALPKDTDIFVLGVEKYACVTLYTNVGMLAVHTVTGSSYEDVLLSVNESSKIIRSSWNGDAATRVVDGIFVLEPGTLHVHNSVVEPCAVFSPKGLKLDVPECMDYHTVAAGFHTAIRSTTWDGPAKTVSYRHHSDFMSPLQVMGSCVCKYIPIFAHYRHLATNAQNHKVCGMHRGLEEYLRTPNRMADILIMVLRREISNVTYSRSQITEQLHVDVIYVDKVPVIMHIPTVQQTIVCAALYRYVIEGLESGNTVLPLFVIHGAQLAGFALTNMVVWTPLASFHNVCTTLSLVIQCVCSMTRHGSEFDYVGMPLLPPLPAGLEGEYRVTEHLTDRVWRLEGSDHHHAILKHVDPHMYEVSTHTALFDRIPGLVPAIFQVTEEYIVMEDLQADGYVALSTLLNLNGSPPQKCCILAELHPVVMDALYEIHKTHVLVDVRPPNILVRHNDVSGAWEVKIIDFETSASLDHVGHIPTPWNPEYAWPFKFGAIPTPSPILDVRMWESTLRLLPTF